MKILIVDDEKDIRDSLSEIFIEEGYETIGAKTAKEAMELASSGIDLVLLDIKLGDDNGIEVLKNIKKERPNLPVIMISGHGTISLTAEAFKLGAHEFMEKPLRLIHVRACVRNALESVKLKNRVSEQQMGQLPKPLYCSKIMKDLYRQTVRLASIKEPVIIMGQSGSGKELIAQTLHYDGVRKNGHFIATNAASLPVNLAEDELFGHEKGAFTGAHTRRKGCLEKANNGTLFLDEIADLDIQIQAKLLRVLETGQFTRLGSTELIRVNVRIIAATHKNLEKLVEKGTFRHDLWFRLCAFILNVPSLDTRIDDILLLAENFLNKACTEMGLKKNLSQKAQELLLKTKYPGNVRELKHIITRATVFSESSVIDEDSIKLAIDNSMEKQHSTREENYSHMDYKSARTLFEKEYFSAILKRNNQNITLSANTIGMAQSNLSRKLKELGLR